MNERIVVNKSIREALHQDLCDLIAFDTSNPPAKEWETAKFMRDRLSCLGAISTLQGFSPRRANAVCCIPFSPVEEGPCLIFNSHLDVVPPRRCPLDLSSF